MSAGRDLNHLLGLLGGSRIGSGGSGSGTLLRCRWRCHLLLLVLLLDGGSGLGSLGGLWGLGLGFAG